MAAGLGATGFMQLEAESGRLCVIGGEEIVLVVVAERTANVGLIRVEMLRSAELLA
jgi:predicted regulator of Ras-like GTPase activity (Roadblock/LC7/MglB family)